MRTKQISLPNPDAPERLGGTFQFAKKLAAILLALGGIVFVLWLDSWFTEHVDMPKLGRNVSYGLLVLVGFLTSFHCVGMCGPLIVGYTAQQATTGNKSYTAHLLYGAGKTLSYTAIGALFGTFGSVVAFTPRTQGLVGIAAGVFLILFGLNMLGVFPALRRFQFKAPAFWMRFVGKEYRKHRNPFAIGLLNGLMIICGTPKLLKASGVIVMILGTVMLNRGLAVTGTGADFNTLLACASQYLSPQAAEGPVCENEQTITMDVLRSGFSPNRFTLRKGIPVKWVIRGKELTECNRGIVVPQYDLKIDLHPGTQVVEFTPKETGVIPWSCWMGMIPGSFIVVENEPESQKPALSERISAYFEPVEQHFTAWAKTWRDRLETP